MNTSMYVVKYWTNEEVAKVDKKGIGTISAKTFVNGITPDTAAPRGNNAQYKMIRTLTKTEAETVKSLIKTVYPKYYVEIKSILLVPVEQEEEA